MSTIYDVVNALLTACEYMHETPHMIKLCQELRHRTINCPCAWTEDGNKIFSVLVLLYGDYGVNPESGWIQDENKGEVLEAIKAYEKTLNKEDQE